MKIGAAAQLYPIFADIDSLTPKIGIDIIIKFAISIIVSEGKKLISAANLVAILDFHHISFSDVIVFCIFGFLDPQNLGKDKLKAWLR